MPDWAMKNSRVEGDGVLWDLYHNDALVLTDGYSACYVHVLTNGRNDETYQEEYGDGKTGAIYTVSELKG